MSERKITLFLGAGASAPLGFPVTSRILPMLLERIGDGSLFSRGTDRGFGQNDAEDLQKFLATLMPGLPTCDAEHVPLITDVLSMIDQLLVADSSPFPGCDVNELRRFRRMLECAIFEMLRWPYRHRHDAEIPELLKKLVKQIITMAHQNQVAIVSTNYDVAVEQELFRCLFQSARESGSAIAGQVDFGMSWRDVVSGAVYVRPPRPVVSVFKLHGSMNWLQCRLCQNIYINPKGTIEHQAFRATTDDRNSCHCGHRPLEVVMVAPSLIREMRDGNLLQVWRSTVEAMRTSEQWVFVGYSLPVEDVAIRNLLVRASQAREDTDPPRVSIVQRGTAAEPRYKLFFPDASYHEHGLEAAIDAGIFA